MLAAPSATYIGLVLDQRYRLERLVGEGASSLIFAATDSRLERQVAIKLLKVRADAPGGYRKSFASEGQVLAKLQHPHVAAVHDAGETADGLAYLVMELLEAGNLEAELRRVGALSVVDTFELLLPIMGALAYAHDRAVVHRDLKPANIIVVREGADKRAKLLDFGIAKLLSSDASQQTQGAVGTPSYMAPEQARAETVGPQADVWALGVLFFRCLSGRLPLQGSSPVATMLKIVQERAPRFEEACPLLPPALAQALDRALEPDLSVRYPDMRAFARAIAQASTHGGLQLAVRPDPLGLPDFAAWLSEPLLHSAERPTGARPSVPVSSVLEPSSAVASTPAPRTLPRATWPVAALLLAAVAGGALLALWGEPSGQPSPTAAMAGQPATPVRKSTPPLAPGASREPLPLLPRLAANAAQPDAGVDPGAASTAAAQPKARRLHTRARSGAESLAAGETSMRESNRAEAAQEADIVTPEIRKPGLVTSWEW